MGWYSLAGKNSLQIRLKVLNRVRNLADAGKYHIGVGGNFLHSQSLVRDRLPVVMGSDGIGELRVFGVRTEAGAHNAVGKEFLDR